MPPSDLERLYDKHASALFAFLLPILALPTLAAQRRELARRPDSSDEPLPAARPARPGPRSEAASPSKV